MGMHVCEYCKDGRLPAVSSGDVCVEFQDGRAFRVPDMLPHYVRVHGYKPPQHFVDLVMAGALVPKNYYSIENGEQVGYLEGPFETGSVPEAFLQRLDDVLLQAEFFGGRQQTKG